MPPEFSRLRILGTRIDAIAPNVALDLAASWLQGHSFRHIVTGNTLMLLEAEHDPALRKSLEHADLVFPESSGLLLASRLRRLPISGIVPGIDFMVKLVEQAAVQGKKVYFLGSSSGVAEAAAKSLASRFPGLQIAGARDGYFSDGQSEAILRPIRESRPALVLVGLGMPRQEKWIAEHRADFGPALVIGVGGSFDVISGRLARAPRWMQRCGLEWLYRLAQEPWRWRRIAQLPVFIWKVLKERDASGMSIHESP